MPLLSQVIKGSHHLGRIHHAKVMAKNTKYWQLGADIERVEQVMKVIGIPET